LASGACQRRTAGAAVGGGVGGGAGGARAREAVPFAALVAS